MGYDGTVTTKYAYEAFRDQRDNYIGHWWDKFIWRSNGSLKIQLFLWLVIKGKALTWEAFKRRGW